MKSIEFIYEKEEAHSRIKQILENNNITIQKTEDVNKGLGLKYICQDGSKFILYYKNNKSSKIIFEKYTEIFSNLFADSMTVEEKIERIPVHAAFSIQKKNLKKIKDDITDAFTTVEQGVSTLTIEYILKVSRGHCVLTITQFKTGKVLLQGINSPLVTEIKAIINKYDEISEKEEALTYVPEEYKKDVEKIIDELDIKFNGYCTNARDRLSTEAFNYLYLHDKEQIVSSLGLLDLLKESKKELPLYNPVIYPISIAFEGFLVKMLLERNVVTQKDYQKNPDVLKIGDWLRTEKFKRYIKDVKRDGYVLQELISCWEGIRCNELHSDPMQNMSLKKLTNVTQAEDLIGKVFSCIRNAYEIIVKSGYTEQEMLSQKQLSTDSTISKREIKDIPSFICHIGTDESGKGDYFGPLVVAGVFVTKEDEKNLVELGVKDSKENSDAKNQSLASQIISILGWNKIKVVFIRPEKYNALYIEMGKNMNSVLGWAHARAIEDLLSKNPCQDAIADQFGDEKVINDALMKQGKKINLLQTPKAERDIAVAAASILARSKFLELMIEMKSVLGFIPHKGASPEVEQQARDIMARMGKDALKRFVKLHFKTTQKITGE